MHSSLFHLITFSIAHGLCWWQTDLSCITCMVHKMRGKILWWSFATLSLFNYSTIMGNDIKKWKFLNNWKLALLDQIIMVSFFFPLVLWAPSWLPITFVYLCLSNLHSLVSLYHFLSWMFLYPAHTFCVYPYPFNASGIWPRF